MTITQNLQGVHNIAADMQFFTPIRGYTYAQKPSKRNVTGPASTRASGFNTPLPDASSHTAPQSEINTREQIDDDSVNENDLVRAFNLSLQYEDDYMDLNPLSGEPGSFVLSSTQGHLRAEKAAKAQAASQKSKLEGKSTSVSAAPSPLTVPRSEAFKKGGKAEKEKTPTSAGPSSKLKRRKSRATGSPDGDG
jgi:mediator of RNA polymerase II transcription subunit 6